MTFINLIHKLRERIEKLEAYSSVEYAFVVVTPDDVGTLKGEPPKACL